MGKSFHKKRKSLQKCHSSELPKAILTSKDSRPNSEEEDRVKQTIMPEKEWLPRTLTNMALQNSDRSQESLQIKLLLKLFTPCKKVISVLLSLLPKNLVNGDLPPDLLATPQLMQLVYWLLEDY